MTSLCISRRSIRAILVSLLGTSSRSIDSSSRWSSTSKRMISLRSLPMYLSRMPKSKSRQSLFWATFKNNDNHRCPISNCDRPHVHNQLTSSTHLSSCSTPSHASIRVNSSSNNNIQHSEWIARSSTRFSPSCSSILFAKKEICFARTRR